MKIQLNSLNLTSDLSAPLIQPVLLCLGFDEMSKVIFQGFIRGYPRSDNPRTIHRGFYTFATTHFRTFHFRQLIEPLSLEIGSMVVESVRKIDGLFLFSISSSVIRLKAEWIYDPGG